MPKTSTTSERSHRTKTSLLALSLCVTQLFMHLRVLIRQLSFPFHWPDDQEGYSIEISISILVYYKGATCWVIFRDCEKTKGEGLAYWTRLSLADNSSCKWLICVDSRLISDWDLRRTSSWAEKLTWLVCSSSSNLCQVSNKQNLLNTGVYEYQLHRASVTDCWLVLSEVKWEIERQQTAPVSLIHTPVQPAEMSSALIPLLPSLPEPYADPEELRHMMTSNGSAEYPTNVHLDVRQKQIKERLISRTDLGIDHISGPLQLAL